MDARDLRPLARLARLNLDVDEVDRLARDLANVLADFAATGDIDVSSVADPETFDPTETVPEDAGKSEHVGPEGAPPGAAAAGLLIDVRRALNARGIGIEEYEVSPQRLANLIRMADDGTVTRAVAREVLGATVERMLFERLREMPRDR